MAYKVCAALAGAMAMAVSGAAAAQKPPAPRAPHAPELSRQFVSQLRAPAEGLECRSQRLLVQELVQLERLFRATPRRSPERVLLLRRLAEGYAELAALAAREKALAEERQRRQTSE